MNGHMDEVTTHSHHYWYANYQRESDIDDQSIESCPPEPSNRSVRVKAKSFCKAHTWHRPLFLQPSCTQHYCEQWPEKSRSQAESKHCLNGLLRVLESVELDLQHCCGCCLSTAALRQG